jgi:hypothetical protein
MVSGAIGVDSSSRLKSSARTSGRGNAVLRRLRTDIVVIFKRSH